MTALGTLEQAARELSELFGPLEDRFAAEGIEGTLADLGLRVPPALASAPSLLTPVGTTLNATLALPGLVAALIEAADADDAAGIASAAAALLGKIKDTVDGVTQTAAALDSLANTLAGLSASQRQELRDFAAALVERIIAELTVDYIERRYFHAFLVLIAVSAIEIVEVSGGPDGSLQAPHQRKLIHFDRILRLLTDPVGEIGDVYKWGAADFDGVALFRMMKVLLDKAVGIPADILQPTGMPATLEAIAFSATVDPTGPKPGLEVSLRAGGDADIEETVAQDEWAIDLKLKGRAANDVDFTLKPPFDVAFQLSSGSVEAELGVDIHRAPAAPPLVLFGKTGGSRLEAGDIRGGADFAARWDTSGAPISLAPSLHAAIRNGLLVITGEGGDSLISEALRGVNVRAPFDLGFTWSPSAGLKFTGSAGLEIEIPAYAQLGPIIVDEIAVALGLNDGGVNLDLAVSVGANLGPVKARINKLGIRALLTFPARGGNVGPANIDLRFKPPTGAAVSLDTPTLTLAGFLDIDEAAHRYAGAVEIRLFNSLELSAIGIVNTVLPDGSKGFSLLFLIDTIFPTPIFLGYNFYLAGVGGMLGLHRSIDLDRLRDDLRNGAAQNILFPRDVAANMTAIISQLEGIFPSKRDQFIIGPMARITWSVPPLIVIDLGLIIEFANPMRVAVLGLMRAAVPDQDDPIVDIKVAFLGAIDFQLGLLSFDASIYDSYIGRGDFRFSFEGDIAVRLSWGQKKDALSSVGGFHPAYTAPAYLRVPKLRRITLSLLKDNPRLRLTSYFAVTTNTVQFGAELDFYFRVSGLSVVGDFGFDVLFQFDPFRFIASVKARVAVRSGSTDLFSLSLTFELQGTTPWTAKGDAKFSILFFSFTVHFEKTWGERIDISAPAIAILPAVLDEFRRDVNWKATLSETATQLVQLFPPAEASGALLVDAAGVLEISQALVPLGAELKKFNNARPSDISSVNVFELRIGGSAVPRADLGDVSEEFAPQAFRDFSDKDKLAAASYEPMKGGVAAAGGKALATDYVIARPVTYESIVDDGTPNVPPTRKKVPGTAPLFTSLVRGGAVGASPLSRRVAVKRQRNSVRDVSAEEETFSVVSTANLTVVDAASRGLSRSQAQDRITKLVAAGRAAADIDMVPAYRAR